MKKFNNPVYIVIVIAMTVFYLFALANTARGQNVVRKGNTFIQVADSTKNKVQPTKTKYTYRTKDGKELPIYLSTNGKAFVIRTSKKTGNQYRQYLPEITKQIGK